MTADVYEWRFTIESFKAYVTNSSGPHATLHKWDVQMTGNDYTNEYANYTEVPAEEAFLAIAPEVVRLYADEELVT